AELERISMDYSGKFSCSMLAARRVFQQAPDHKLGTLVDYMNISVEGVFHRALYDSEMTAKLWLAMLDDIRARYALSEIDFKLMQRLAKTPKHAVDNFWRSALPA
ncbi:MAG: DNA polymerase-3 subunit epsilon, partial [Halioglobus sp.]